MLKAREAPQSNEMRRQCITETDDALIDRLVLDSRLLFQLAFGTLRWKLAEPFNQSEPPTEFLSFLSKVLYLCLRHLDS